MPYVRVLASETRGIPSWWLDPRERPRLAPRLWIHPDGDYRHSHNYHAIIDEVNFTTQTRVERVDSPSVSVAVAPVEEIDIQSQEVW